jgi:3-deoxy-manno-octulosonate cytidylyltransferase (CMP-KDO synthetase)
MKTAIVIPARYGSTRLPGKPLAVIAGKTMLQRTVQIAQNAAKTLDNVTLAVATDHESILKHCEQLDIKGIMTPVNCPTGTHRVEAALWQLDQQPDFIINLQADAPLTPPDFITAMIESQKRNSCDMMTLVSQMTWEQLDIFRENKKTTPFSGTLAFFDPVTGNAHWFSKNMVPALRNEKALREESALSPLYRHIGIYGYSRRMLLKYTSLPEGGFEAMEGLEQLRALENGYSIRCVPVDYKGRASMSGVDSPEDVGRAEALIAKHGELLAA